MAHRNRSYVSVKRLRELEPPYDWLFPAFRADRMGPGDLEGTHFEEAQIRHLFALAGMQRPPSPSKLPWLVRPYAPDRGLGGLGQC
jgi:hypothetical protein